MRLFNHASTFSVIVLKITDGACPVTRDTYVWYLVGKKYLDNVVWVSLMKDFPLMEHLRVSFFNLIPNHSDRFLQKFDIIRDRPRKKIVGTNIFQPESS